MSKFSNSQIVITGARGFVGQHLIRELQEKWSGTKIISWDLPDVDITKPETYRDRLAAEQPDWLVHLAALAAVGASEKLKEHYEAVNTRGTELVLETMAEVSPGSRALVVSSAEVYGLALEARAGQPVGELSLAECRPANPYAESKLAMERMIAERFADRTIRVRPFPHIGPGQKTGFVTADFAAQIAKIEKSAAPREASRGARRSGVMRVGNLTSSRDFTDVRDVVRAYRLLMEHGLTGEACPAAERELGMCGVFNIASGRAYSIQAVLDQFLALSDADIRIEHDSSRFRSIDIPVVVGDASKLKEAVGWAPEIPLPQSLRDILDWWRAHALPR